MPSVIGAIRDKWLALGGPQSFLGQPLTDESSTPDGIGRFNHFQGGFHMKKWWNYLVISSTVTILVGGIATSTWAGEKGKFRGRAVLYTPKYTESKVLDTPEHIVYQGEQDGMIFNESGGTFLEKARYQ